ncbi:MAG TPA: phosphate ABC transporter ATP-binding protein [Burkholderiales bacterium]|nr:phosphate ABC transporter ATP-binding protein [Burkholderiales bacterium]
MNMSLPEAALSTRAHDDAVLEARALTIAYANEVRVRKATVSFPRNRVTAIIGPSGCGKSTLLRGLNRTLELIPDARIVSGQVLLNGKDVYGSSMSASWVRTHIGMLQQRPATFPMSIAENTLFGARYHGYVRDQTSDVKHYLGQVGLWEEVADRLSASAHTLSGGQQQRLCLARTLAVRPSVVLMDEPCSALDPRATAVIERLIRELTREYTIVVVTHNIAQARRIADHCIFMLDGEVLAAGTREEILLDPQHPTVRDFVTGQIG